MVTKAQLFTSLLVSFGRQLLSEQAAAPMFKILGERSAFYVSEGRTERACMCKQGSAFGTCELARPAAMGAAHWLSLEIRDCLSPCSSDCSDGAGGGGVSVISFSLSFLFF